MPISSHNLAEFIRSEGWSNHAILPIDDVQKALEHHKGVFEQWIKAGYQADMHYLEKMKPDRFHPQNKLPEVKSVIVLLATYSSDSPRMVNELSTNGLNSAWSTHCPTNGLELRQPVEPSVKQSVRQPVEPSGIVARYARGRDYHKVLKKKLIQLSDWLKSQQDGVETYLSVDSGPTVDRVLAEAAGLGFFGKNSMMIDPRRGSYFFIASLMTNVVLEPTEKGRMPNCGDCRKCMVACPTNAIVAPGVIDARRCIAYLTIENKGGIPLELRSKLGNRLFGCDICQEVCPFNVGRAGRQVVQIEALRPDHGVGECLDLKEILSMETDEQFLARFAGTPLMRAKRRGLLRNVCVVAGNSGDPTLIPYLERVFEREVDEMLKEHAKWGIEQLQIKN